MAARETPNRDTPNREAYEWYLRGEETFSLISKEALSRAQACFEEATKLAPEFARAWGYLAYTKAQIAIGRWGEGSGPNKALLGRALADAKKAVKLDDRDYANWWDLAFCQLQQGKHEESTASFDTAVQLFREWTPHIDCKAGLLAEAGEAQLYFGNHMRAIELLEESLRVPDWYLWALAGAYYCAHEYDKAMDALDRMYRQPGDPKYSVGAEVLRANLYVRLSERHATGSDECRFKMEKAGACLAKFLSKVPGWTCRKEAAHLPFRRAEDRKHWMDAVKKAGLPA